MINTVKDADDKYELIILTPSHFLISGCPMVIKHPTTNQVAPFYPSQDCLLHEGSPTGPRLPSLYSRGDIERRAPLNPILVTFAAMVRLRRRERQNARWNRGLNPQADLILQEAERLFDAVTWEPERSAVPLEDPPQLPDHQSASMDDRRNLKASQLPIITWDDVEKLMLQGAFRFHRVPLF